MNTIIEAKKLAKNFKLEKNNEVAILKDINLHIARGEFVSIMGPSGSGKSTLLYNISGMDRPSSGSVTFKGETISTLSEKKLAELRLTQMGFIFQQMHLLKNLSILDNIILPALHANSKRKNRDSKKIIREKGMSLLEKTGISHIAHKAISQTSGGELQRAAICRALINDPQILFGDEPTGALNSSSSHDILNLLSGIHSEGKTILLVTHDVRVAAKSERVVFILDGKVAGEKKLGPCSGSTEEILKREEVLSGWLNRQGF